MKEPAQTSSTISTALFEEKKNQSSKEWKWELKKKWRTREVVMFTSPRNMFKNTNILYLSSLKKNYNNNNNNNKKQNVKSNSTAQVWSYIDHVFIQSPAAETPQL